MNEYDGQLFNVLAISPSTFAGVVARVDAQGGEVV
jgi:hypothetical protein